jgi:hypothetical protein
MYAPIGYTSHYCPPPPSWKKLYGVRDIIVVQCTEAGISVHRWSCSTFCGYVMHVISSVINRKSLIEANQDGSLITVGSRVSLSFHLKYI